MKTTVLTGKDLNKSKKQIANEIKTDLQLTEEISENLEKDSVFVEKTENNELLKAYNELKAELEEVKASAKPLTLDFEQAAKLFRQKSKLLDEISQLQKVLDKVINTNVSDHTDNDGLDSSYYSIGLLYSSRNEPIFKFSNLTVINEFLDFIANKLTIKIDALKLQVQEL